MNRLDKIRERINTDYYTFRLIIPEKRFLELSRDSIWLLNHCLILRDALIKIQIGVSGDFYSNITPDEIYAITDLALKEEKK